MQLHPTLVNTLWIILIRIKASYANHDLIFYSSAELAISSRNDMNPVDGQYPIKLLGRKLQFWSVLHDFISG